MRRYALTAAVFVALFAAGVAAATHTSVVEEHVLPFTIGDVTGEVTLTDTDQLPHETVTVTVTGTTQPPTEPPPPPDTIRPEKPILSLGPVTQTSMTLNWQAGSDNVGVDHYNVYLDGVKLHETNELTWTYTGLECGSTYEQGLTVEDAAGNTSLLAEARWGRSTLACDSPPPTDPPSPPSGFPNASNTGPTGTLTNVSGNLTITTAGAVIQNQNRTGCIDVRANNVTIRNSEIHCLTNDYGIDHLNGNTGLVMEDLLVECGTTNGTCITTTSAMTLRRSEVFGSENLVWANRDAVIEDNYIHDPMPYNPQTDPHTDGIQMSTPTSNVTIRHNTIYGSYIGGSNFGNSAITSGQSTNVLVTNNLLAGGGHTLRCPAEPGGYTWTNNRFSRIFVFTVGGFGPLEGSCDQHIHFGNVIHETGEPLD